MELIQVRSEMIYAVGYDAEAHTLDVIFYRTGVYRYLGVPPEVYDGLLRAESKGRYMRSAIIGKFRDIQLRGPSRKR